MERDRFSGCILGGYLGDVIGAPVESESAAYIGKTYRDLDHILERPWVEEILGLQALPKRWLARVREDEYPPGRVQKMAEALYEKFGR